MNRAPLSLVVAALLLFGGALANTALALTGKELATAIINHSVSGAVKWQTVATRAGASGSVVSADGRTYNYTFNKSFANALMDIYKTMRGGSCGGWFDASFVGCPLPNTGFMAWFTNGMVAHGKGTACTDPDPRFIYRSVTVSTTGAVNASSCWTEAATYNEAITRINQGAVGTSFYQLASSMWRSDGEMSGNHPGNYIKEINIPTMAQWRANVAGALDTAIDSDKPNVTRLISHYGVTVAEIFTDEGWERAPATPTGTPGTGTGTPGTTQCGAGQTRDSSGNCVDRVDEDSVYGTCSIIDIPCNLKRLFIPKRLSSISATLSDAMVARAPFSILAYFNDVPRSCTLSVNLTWFGHTGPVPIDVCFFGAYGGSIVPTIVTTLGIIAGVFLAAIIGRIL